MTIYDKQAYHKGEWMKYHERISIHCGCTIIRIVDELGDFISKEFHKSAIGNNNMKVTQFMVTGHKVGNCFKASFKTHLFDL